ncbi:AAA family ATPase [Paraburkholderia bengalensis]|uniref:AAA family ATPase n=1 Tax=Paraburkholderia bengalensis TaxID=2747562 RepID=A0ABU8J3W1_9BURK
MTHNLRTWLVQSGLGEHAAAFESQGIDWDVLGDLSGDDLKELGLTLGDRKRLAKALAGLTESRDYQAACAKKRRASPSSTARSIEAERRQLTVMFIDLIDSTTLAERFDPEEMRRLLAAYHQACASATDAYEGHIALYVGDGVDVYFGYPNAHEDDAIRAVLAGFAVIAALRRANERIETEHGVRLHVRIRIETGLVVVGTIGDGSALDHQAIVGEAPIVAARLQALAPPDSIMVGPVSCHLIEGSFRLEDLGRRRLKGVTGAVRVQRVLAPIEAVDRFEIRTVHGVTPLVGRAAELDMIRQRWEHSVDGEMGCVLVIGEPGIGKSRVLRAFCDSIRRDDHEVVSFHCSPYHRNSPFWPVIRWLQRAVGLGPDGNIEQLRTDFTNIAVDAEEARFVLATLLGIPTDARHPDPDVSSPSFNRLTLDVLVAIVEDLTRVRPLLVMVEDAQWIDPSSREFVPLVIARLVTARLLVLMTARTGFAPEWNYPHLLCVKLDRLSRRESVAIIEQLTNGKPLPGSVLDQIVSKTDGVPLFVEELTKAVLQGDLLHDLGTSYELRRAPRAIAIPDTLQGSLLSRLDRLDPIVKEVAQIAATVGREFGTKLLRLIASQSESELQETLKSLVAAEIIVPASSKPGEGGTYRFRHALIQEIAYQSLLLERRRQYHALIAAALEEHYPEIADRQPELIAQNYAAANLPERAISYWRRAGERALAGAAYDEAIAHVRSGLELANKSGLSEHGMRSHLLKILRNLLDRAEHSRRDVYLASAVDLCELERRMRSIGTDD